MYRLRYAMAAVLLATGATGCVTFCDECDDFPISGGYAAMPGTYTGPPLTHGGESRTESIPSETASPFAVPSQPKPPTPEEAPPEPNAMNRDQKPAAPVVAVAPAADQKPAASTPTAGELPPLP
jgi:hypothetical protein